MDPHLMLCRNLSYCACWSAYSLSRGERSVTPLDTIMKDTSPKTDIVYTQTITADHAKTGDALRW